jgi:O-antigen/teichoic acid export membrane protein
LFLVVTFLKPEYQSKALFRGAFILTIAAFITKILSAFYRIPFQNIVGDVGFYIYQQVYPFYGMAMVLSTTGFPVVISKLYAEQKGKDAKEANILLVSSFIYLQLVGIVCFAILFFGSGTIAVWMNDPKLAVLLKVVSFVFLTFPAVSLMRGYYQGRGDMVPTAISQVGEQSIRVLTIILLSVLFTKKGYSLYLVGGGAMFGSITGSVVSALILFTYLRKRKEWEMENLLISPRERFLPELKRIFKEMTFQGLTICVSGMLLILIQMADSMNLYSLLVSGGMNESLAKSMKGVYDRGQPLIQLGTVAATSMSLSLVPLISSSRLKEKPDFLYDKMKAALKISVVIAVGASAGLSTIIRPTNMMLFENASGSSVLGVLSYVILFTAIISTLIAIMQGLGQVLFPAIAVIVSFPIKYGLNFLLISSFGMMGAAWSTIVTLLFVTVLLLMYFRRMLKSRLLTPKFYLMVAIAAVAMIICLKIFLFVSDFVFWSFFPERIAAALQALSAAVFGGILFLFIIIRGKVFRDEELTLFPFGSKLRLLMAKENRS